MAPSGCLLPPSSSLPPLSTLSKLSELQIFSAIRGLSALYCPLPASVAFKLSPENNSLSHPASTPLVDSGYTSGTEDDNLTAAHEKSLDALRADGFERSFAERWLTGFMARAYDLPGLDSEDAQDRALDQASWVLESFVVGTANEDELGDDQNDFMREFSFKLAVPGHQQEIPVDVRLNDGLAGKNSTDADDVGLQSWGASIVFSDLMCAEPSRFGLTQPTLGSSPRIIELGAGTGLVSLVLAAMLPHLGATKSDVIATDYHPAVLDNLRTNIATNFPSNGPVSIHTSLLDWSAPVLESPLDLPADILLATDVVYAPEHAVWLRDCATRLLAPDGVFWLLVTVRQNGRFEGISNTVEEAFATTDRPRGKDGRLLRILSSEKLEKRGSVGRGDESGYRLFRLGWT
ncbi:putative methyltransferase-domain-containing protein [Dactylonectria macrodidyma]|uniref:Methyltransferase-domain-containing protein n=1 Tax=Dactylonectria macrodidyma TaxID=307937 RepID=A0A9P9EFV1_9HYPO|nr:putative methyltransferase-domain-containing protein [Dactylonectria macrodidyma]